MLYVLDNIWSIKIQKYDVKITMNFVWKDHIKYSQWQDKLQLEYFSLLFHG